MLKQKQRPMTYQQAGVNIDAGNKAVTLIKKHVRTTYGKEVLSDIGLFGGLFDVSRLRLKEPVLVSSTDGVGTKVKVAIAMKRHDTVGQDLVQHCINDIMVQGARPLFFLDYIGLGKLSPFVVEQIVKGMATACRHEGCALIGGEMAEMPDVYEPGDYDLAGFIVGAVEKNKIIDGRSIRPGDVLIGLASTGLHTNGYTLARHIFFKKMKWSPVTYSKFLKNTIGGELLTLHRCYAQSVLPLVEKFSIHGMAHITGGGFLDNIPRILPDGCQAVIKKGSWPILKIFQLLQEKGQLDELEAYRTFNMGIGLIIMVAAKDVKSVMQRLSAREKCYILGEIVKGEKKVVLLS